MVSMPPVPQELELIDPILKQGGFIKTPNMVVTVYKGRMSKYPKETKIWQYVDLGTMRVEDLFCTDKYYNPIHVEKTYVNVLEEEDVDKESQEKTIKF